MEGDNVTLDQKTHVILCKYRMFETRPTPKSSKQIVRLNKKNIEMYRVGTHNLLVA